MPIVELTKLARQLEAGEKIEVTATDLAFRPDVEAWARRMGHTIDSYETNGSLQRAIITLQSKKP
jgi:TusA-related sulfurtransferase